LKLPVAPHNGDRHFSKLFNVEEKKGIIHSRIYPARDVVQPVWYNISTLIRYNCIIKNYVNHKITSYIYLLIFTISLWLMIEKGRHRKIDLENRLCPLCKFEVEDELHFTIKCTKLQELRNKFYQKISDILPSFYNLSDTVKCHLIFRSNDYDVSKCCIKGISEMYKFRCSLT
jgi:hypothetical protein